MPIVLGTERFGQPDAECVAAPGAIASVDRLEDLGRRRITDPAVDDRKDLPR